MRGLFKNKYQLLIFNNSLFSLLHFNSFFISDIFLSLPIINFQTKILFHPKRISLEVGEPKSFFDHILYLRYFLNSFTNSYNKLKKLYFTKFKRSSFKFRKRKNIYFSLIYSSNPINNLFFFKNLFNFILFFNSISKRLYQIYFLKIAFFKLSYKNGVLTFFFLNPQYYYFYVNDKKFIKKDFIVKLNIYFPYKNKEFVYSLLKSIYQIDFN